MARNSLAGLLAVLALFLQCALALKFDLRAEPGHSSKNERCIRNFVNRDTLVVVTATVGGSKGDGMVVNMHVSLSECLHSWFPDRPLPAWLVGDVGAGRAQKSELSQEQFADMGDVRY